MLVGREVRIQSSGLEEIGAHLRIFSFVFVAERQKQIRIREFFEIPAIGVVGCVKRSKG